MKFEIETGTDVGAVAIAADGGSTWRADTGADGAYLVHLFVDEEPPDSVAPFLRDRQVIETFEVPSGRLVVGGEEFVAEPRRLAKYPHMGAEVQVPAGTYELHTFRVDESRDDEIDARFATSASDEELRAWKRNDTLGAMCVGAAIAAVVIAVVLRSAIPVLVAAAFWFGFVRVRRSAAYVAAELRYREIERELPSIVIVLRRASGA